MKPQYADFSRMTPPESHLMFRFARTTFPLQGLSPHSLLHPTHYHMQNLSKFILLLLAALAVACSPSTEGKQVDVEEATDVADVSATDTLSVNTEASIIHWKGTEPGDEGHSGIISLKSGELYVDGAELTGGQFVIDMLSINVTDLEGGKKAKLEGHLMTSDFFESTTYPEGTFTIAGIEAADGDSTATHYLTGNLALKDSIKSITIPASISMDEAGLMAETPAFTIDRTQWGVMYKSGVIGTVADNLIDDQIGLQIKLVATK